MWKWGISFDLLLLMRIVINKILKEKCIKNEKNTGLVNESWCIIDQDEQSKDKKGAKAHEQWILGI